MNKRGIEQKIVIEGIIALILIFLIFAMVGGANILKNLSNFLPFFGDDDSRTTVRELPKIRYDVVNDEISYYTGVEWKLIKGVFNYGGNEIESSVLKVTFKDYYYGRGKYADLRAKNPSIELSGGNLEFFGAEKTFSRKIPELRAYLEGVSDIEVNEIQKGAVYGFLADKKFVLDGEDIFSETDRSGLTYVYSPEFPEIKYPVLKNFRVDINNDFYVFEDTEFVKKEDLGENTKQITAFSDRWRDSILKYSFNVGKKKYCVSDFYGRYLVADLNAESENEFCGEMAGAGEEASGEISATFSYSPYEITSNGKIEEEGRDARLRIMDNLDVQEIRIDFLSFKDEELIVGKVQENIIDIFDSCIVGSHDVLADDCILLDNAKIAGQTIYLNQDSLDKWRALKDKPEVYNPSVINPLVEKFGLEPQVFAGYVLHYTRENYYIPVDSYTRTRENYKGKYYFLGNGVFFEGGFYDKGIFSRRVDLEPQIYFANRPDLPWNLPGMRLVFQDGEKILVREGYGGFYYFDEDNRLIHAPDYRPGEKAEYIEPYSNIDVEGNWKVLE